MYLCIFSKLTKPFFKYTSFLIALELYINHVYGIRGDVYVILSKKINMKTAAKNELFCKILCWKNSSTNLFWLVETRLYNILKVSFSYAFVNKLLEVSEIEKQFSCTNSCKYKKRYLLEILCVFFC